MSIYLSALMFEVVNTRGRLGIGIRCFSTRDPNQKLPVVVLINKRSASASEIVSGALQDLDRGFSSVSVLMAKVLVQNTKDIGFNSKLKLTTSKYYIPSGRCIQSVSYHNGSRWIYQILRTCISGQRWQEST